MSQNDALYPHTHLAKKNLPGGQQDQGCRVVLNDQGEGYGSTLTFRRRVVK